MRVSKRILSIIIALMILAGMSCIVVYATDSADLPQRSGAEYNGDQGSGDQGSGDQGSGDQGSGDQGSGDQGSGDQGSGDQGSGDQGSGDQGSGDQNYGDQGSGDQNYGGNDYNYNSPGYVENNNDDPVSWGDNSSSVTYDEGSAGSVSDKTTLYDTSDINNKDLDENQWSNIEIDEGKVAAAGGVDFSAIKTDTETEDNGQWILYVGIILIGLALLGIAYFIIATIQAKNRQNNYNDNRRPPSGDRRPASPDRRRPPQQRSSQGRPANRPPSSRPRTDRPQGAQSRPRPVRTPDRTAYSDDYSAPRRKSSRSDTDEIYLPRRVK